MNGFMLNQGFSESKRNLEKSLKMVERKIDERKIAFEVFSAAFRQNRYSEVNETKKRSIVTAGSYEEYRNLVRCAEIGQKAVTADEMKMIRDSEMMRKRVMRGSEVEHEGGEAETEFKGFNMRYQFDGRRCTRRGELLEKYAKDPFFNCLVESVRDYLAKKGSIKTSKV